MAGAKSNSLPPRYLFTKRKSKSITSTSSRKGLQINMRGLEGYLALRQ